MGVKLKPCPFCGSEKLKLVKKSVYIKDIKPIPLLYAAIVAMLKVVL